MREHLYRAKKADDYKQFVYGTPVYQSKDGFEMYCNSKRYGEEMGIFTVIQKTLGEYTSENDCKGKKIFEHDIVEGTIHSAWVHKKIRCVVAWGKYGFECREYEHGLLSRYATHSLKFGKDVKVIGNIFDDKHLIMEEV